MSSSGFREACDPHRSMGVQLGLRLTMACDHSFWTHEEWLCDIVQDQMSVLRTQILKS